MSDVLERLAEQARDEVVTSFHVRDVRLPGGTGRLALVTMENGLDHTRPTTFGVRGLLRLRDALDEVERRVAADEVQAVGLTGKPFVFAVGADLSGVGRLRTREEALAVARLGHEQLRRFGELGVPSFAYVGGAAIGGGLEAALHCTYRTASDAVRAIGLSETALGLVPGWGGAWLLPRLVGPDAAVAVVVENPVVRRNRMLTAAQAGELGLVDVVLESADFLEQSLAWSARVLAGEVVVERPDRTRDADAWAAAVARGRAAVDAELHGAAPAPYAAIGLLEAARTADRDAGFAAEDEALADLVLSEEFRAGAYAFDLVQRRAKRPAGAPPRDLARPVRKVGVVGAGLMASQLALLLARRLQVPVVMTDLDAERVERGLGWVRGQVDDLLAKGRLSPDGANRLRSLVTGSTAEEVFGDADLVVEAVFERMDVKEAVFAALEAVVRPDCLLMTNTSSLSVEQMASGLAHPERVVGFHFFNPVAAMPLLEVVRAPRTDDATLATAFAVGAQLGKSCVLVRDAPAFVVNRLLTRFLGVVLAAVDDGTPQEEADRALEPLGLPMPPSALLQLVGPAVALHVAEALHAAFGDRFPVSEGLRRLVAGEPPAPGSEPWAPDDLRARALEALAEEVRLLLDEGVVAEPQDVDLCLLLGAGWPSHLGGITPHLDRTGTSERVTGRRFLPRGVASVPA